MLFWYHVIDFVHILSLKNAACLLSAYLLTLKSIAFTIIIIPNQRCVADVSHYTPIIINCKRFIAIIYIAIKIILCFNVAMKNENRLIDRVVEHFGNAYKASEAYKIKHQMFYAWLNKGYIPFKRGADTERVTNGAIKAIEVWEEAGRLAK